MLGVTLFLIGLGLSALFSGSETGFYRATRARWVLDGQAGDRYSRILLWWANNPAVFVSNILIGNNLANYLVSLGIVMVAGQWFMSESDWVEMVATIAMTPVVFLYGESLPKQVFLQAPNRLLRWVVPFLLFINIILLPAVLVLWMMGRFLETLVGKSPERIQSRIARQELINMFREGHTAGLLEPVQLSLAQNFFDMVDKTLDPLLIPLGRAITIKEGIRVGDALEIARRHQLACLPMVNGNGTISNYVLVEELLLQSPAAMVVHTHPLPKIPQTTSVAKSLIVMRSTQSDLALVVDGQDQDQVKGLLSVQRLQEQLYSGALARWRQ